MALLAALGEALAQLVGGALPGQVGGGLVVELAQVVFDLTVLCGAIAKLIK